MNHGAKYNLLWQLFILNPDDPELFAYIKKNFTRMFQYAINHGNMNVIEAVCENGELLTKRNIDKFIDGIIASIQKGGANKDKKVAIQMKLSAYREEKLS